MQKKVKSNFLEMSELAATLDVFVEFGVLIKTTKNGEDAWKNNPEFDKKSKKEQETIFSRIQRSSEIPTEILKEMTGVK